MTLVPVRHAYAHDATVVLDPGGDPAAPGAAVTAGLCGHWAHPPPCPLAPHHTAANPEADALGVRILFAADPADEVRVRSVIETALAGGRLTDTDGRTTTWTLRAAGPGAPRSDEADHAARLIASARLQA